MKSSRNRSKLQPRRWCRLRTAPNDLRAKARGQSSQWPQEPRTAHCGWQIQGQPQCVAARAQYINQRNPAFSSAIEQMAKAMCGDDFNPMLLEQALTIAETELVLRCLRAEQVAVIERLWDGTAIALAKGDNSMALAKARARESDLAWEELDRIKARFGIIDDDAPSHVFDEMERQPPQPGWMPTPAKERDEVDAVCAALPDLERFLRYERRAWSRRKRAIREFIEIKSSAIPGTIVRIR